MSACWPPARAPDRRRLDSDVKALLRIATLYNVPIAINRATADFLISSPLLASSYERRTSPRTDHHDILGRTG